MAACRTSEHLGVLTVLEGDKKLDGRGLSEQLRGFTAGLVGE